MATRIDQLKDALIKAHTAGDTEAAQLFADEIKGIQSPVETGMTDVRGIPEFLPPQEALALREQQTAERGQLAQRKAGAGFFNKITGALEVPASLATGAYGSLYGATKALLPQALGGTNLAFEQSVAKEGQRFMYQPRTVSGQEYLPKVADVIQQSGIEGLPALSQVSSLSRLRPVTGMPMMQTPQAIEQAKVGISKIGEQFPSIRPRLEQKAYEVMQSALKPTYKQSKAGKTDVAARTLLENNLNISKESVEVMRNKISELNDTISNKIQSSTGTVNKTNILSYLDELRDKKAKQVNPTADLAAIDQVANEFMMTNRPKLGGPRQTIPVQLAQELKQGTYSALNKKYGQMGSTEVEAQKALARGMKEKVAGEVPDIVKFNKQESNLLDTLDVVERRAIMDLNKDYVGMGWLAENFPKTAGFMATRSPAFKTLFAKMLYKASGAKPSGILTQPERAKITLPQQAGLLSLTQQQEQGQQ
jgi:hypothetical protein